MIIKFFYHYWYLILKLTKRLRELVREFRKLRIMRKSEWETDKKILLHPFPLPPVSCLVPVSTYREVMGWEGVGAGTEVQEEGTLYSQQSWFIQCMVDTTLKQLSPSKIINKKNCYKVITPNSIILQLVKWVNGIDRGSIHEFVIAVKSWGRWLLINYIGITE